MEAALLRQAAEVARAAVSAGSEAALRHFRAGVSVDRKSDGSPVTDADRAAERVMLEEDPRGFPEHSILSEESGSQDRDPRHRWILDPLDGTHGFTRGEEGWGPIVAYECDGVRQVGAIALAARDRHYWAARGLGCWCGDERLRVSERDSWEQATLSLGCLERFADASWSEGLLELCGHACRVRCLGDLAGIVHLLDGKAEAWIEAGVAVWDLAGIEVLVEEAGGRIEDPLGGKDWRGGAAVASNGAFQADLRALLAERRGTAGSGSAGRTGKMNRSVPAPWFATSSSRWSR